MKNFSKFVITLMLLSGGSLNANAQLGYQLPAGPGPVPTPSWVTKLPSPLGNNGVFVTDGSGNPSISTTLPSGLAIPQINDQISTLTISGSAAALANSAFYGNVATVNGTYSGTQPSAVYSNSINSFGVSGGHSLENTRVYTNFGGANQVGGFLNFDTTLFINQAITNDPTNEFYQASNVNAVAQVNVGGTSGSPLGHLFSDGHYAHLQSGATNWWSVWGDEYDISIASGASAKLAGGLSVVLLSDNAVAPTQEFPAFIIGAQSGATPTISCGFCFTGYEGNNGLASSASLMALLPHGGSGSYPQATVTNGIDLHLFATTNKAWRGPNDTSAIDGSGNAAFASVVSTSISPTATVAIGGDGSTHNGIKIISGTTVSPGVVQAYSLNTNQSLALQPQGTAATQLQTSGGGIVVNAGGDTQYASGDFLDIHGLASGGNAVYTTVGGPDTNISMRFFTRGTSSTISFGAGGDSPNSGNADFEIDGASSPTSWLIAKGSTTSLPSIGVHGTNIGIALSPNGSGLVNITNSASFVAATNCGSLASSTGCLAIKDNNGNTVFLPVYGTL